MRFIHWRTDAVQEVLILLAVTRPDRFVVGKPLERFLCPFIQLLPSGLGRRLMGQDAFQRREAVGVIPHPTLHRAQHVAFVISVQEPEYLQRLMLAVALFRFESCEIRHADFAQLGEAFSQPLHLFFVVPRRRMGRIDAMLSRESLEHHVPSDFRKRAVVGDQMLFGDSHRQRLANQPPGNRVTIIGVLDRAVGIDDPIHDLRGIERQRGQWQQMRSFFRVSFQRCFLGRSMHSRVGNLRQPPAGHFVKMFQGPELATVE